MRGASSALVLRSLDALVLRSLRTLHANGCHDGQPLLASSVRVRLYANQRKEDSSASNWGTGEPPIDEKQTQRGVSREQASGMSQNTSASGTREVGRHDEPTSTSRFDSGASSSAAAAGGTSRAGVTKKSKTGSDMSEDGQVHTPHLGKMRTTREMIHDKGRETEEKTFKGERLKVFQAEED